MFRKINQYLLTRYPLIWNTRIHILLPITLLINGLFYLAGYITWVEMSNIHKTSLENELLVLFSVLVSVVVLLLWLSQYLRNNPLKSRYPVSRAYLFGEFCILLVVFFSGISFFLSYHQGLYDKIDRVTEKTDLVSQVNTYNLARHFISIPYDRSDCRESCDSIRVRERLADSLGIEVYQIDRSYDENPNALNSSYLCYCEQDIRLDGNEEKDRFELDSIAREWLLAGQKDSVLRILKEAWDLVYQYGGKSDITPESQVEECFRYEGFRITRVVSPRYDSYGTVYLDLELVREAVYRIENVRDGFMDQNEWSGVLYLVFSLSILLMSFRLTRLKHWLLAALGILIWMILFGLIMSQLHHDLETGFLIIYTTLVLSFSALTVILIRNRSSKLASGITLNWVMWNLLAILPAIWGLIQALNHRTCYEYSDPCEQTALYTWLKSNFDHMLLFNLGFVMLLFLLWIIPLARQWQANPEE